MKTTIILPDALVRRAKVRAAETGLTLSALVARALESSLAAEGAVQEPKAKRQSYWARHKPLLLPSRRKDGKVSDSTDIISEDREGR
jgi:hypothetical protein